MFPLKQSLAEYGFESRESYDFAVQCFLNNPTENIRCLFVDGEQGRRKSAFAHALGQALNFDQVLYFEFGVEKPMVQVVRMHEGEEVSEEPPTEPFDRVMTEACALSEAETVVLIIDQLHLAEFQQHLRLYEFIKSKTWSYSDVSFFANQQNLLVFLISDEPLYHSLQHQSYRIWIKPAIGETDMIQPDELGLGGSKDDPAAGGALGAGGVMEHPLVSGHLLGVEQVVEQRAVPELHLGVDPGGGAAQGGQPFGAQRLAVDEQLPLGRPVPAQEQPHQARLAGP